MIVSRGLVYRPMSRARSPEVWGEDAVAGVGVEGIEEPCDSVRGSAFRIRSFRDAGEKHPSKRDCPAGRNAGLDEKDF
jgi:hypothetical protein